MKGNERKYYMNDDIKQSSNGVDSHVQIPRFLMKEFQNNSGMFYYYDIEKEIVCKKGFAKSINTEIGYYSNDIEKFLNDNIENPLSKVLPQIKKIYDNDEKIIIDGNVNFILKKFIYALLARGLSKNEDIEHNSKLLDILRLQDKHDYIVKRGIDLAVKGNLFDDFIVTYMTNKTEIPFVLSMDGIYNYNFNGHLTINLPITPYIVATLIHKDNSKHFLNNDTSVKVLEIDNIEFIKVMNESAFKFQIKRNWGYVICPKKEELDRLKEKFKKI